MTIGPYNWLIYTCATNSKAIERIEQSMDQYWKSTCSVVGIIVKVSIPLGFFWNLIYVLYVLQCFRKVSIKAEYVRSISLVPNEHSFRSFVLFV